MKQFLTGLAAGLAVSYLTAPRSGKDVRKQVSDTTAKQTEALKEQWAKTTTQVKKLAQNMKSKEKPNLFADMEAGKYDRFLTNEERVSVHGTATTNQTD